MHLSGRALFTRPLLYHAFSCSPRRQFPDGAPLSAAVSVYEPPPRYAPSSLRVSLADGAGAPPCVEPSRECSA